MTNLTRRSLLLGATALAGTAALPPVALLAESLPAPAMPAADQAAARLPAWVVGTPGEGDWEVIRAATEEDAIAGWLDDLECECGEVLDSGEVIGRRTAGAAATASKRGAVSHSTRSTSRAPAIGCGREWATPVRVARKKPPATWAATPSATRPSARTA